MTGETAFAGFSASAIQFLADLAANNDRAWFQPRKAEYERLLKHPLEALCTALAVRLAERGVPLDADPATSLFRIYRDTRFSRDKSPYKTAASARFPYRGGTPRVDDGPGGVGGYFHLQPGEIYVGGGMWHPEPARLAAWRTTVADNPSLVHRALEDSDFVRTYGLIDGERLTRVPAGFGKDHPDAELLKLKDVTFGRRLSDADVLSAALPDTLAADLAAAIPVLRLLAELPT